MAETKGYTGKIGRGGNDYVEAPVKGTSKKGKSVVKTGGDLRTKGGK